LENFEMKKTLIALAALAATGAFAQSSVTLYGAVDASVEHDAGNGLTVNKMNNSNLGSSKLGFKGTEDLGGGLKAVFKLEGGLKNESGNGKSSNTTNAASGTNTAVANGSQGLDFQRYSYVGLAGNFGEVHLGREYIWSFWYGEGTVDPFSTNGPAQATNMFYHLGGGAYVGTNASNMVTYITPDAPVQGGVQYYFGQNVANSTATVGHSDGTGYSAFLKYQQGPLLITGAYSRTQYQAAGDYKVTALSAQYDITSAASVMYTYAKEQQTTFGNNTENMIAATYTVGAVKWKASYIHASQDGVTAATTGTGNQYGLGVDYALSKRTKLYTTVAEVTNDGNGKYVTGSVGANTNTKSGNVAVGVYSAF
jgi:predicted porin